MVLNILTQYPLHPLQVTCESCTTTTSPRWHNWISGPTGPLAHGKLCNACNGRWKLNSVCCEKCHYIPRVVERGAPCPRCHADNSFVRNADAKNKSKYKAVNGQCEAHLNPTWT